jgi:hypothetical protein
LVATREMARVTNPSKPRGQRPASGGLASVRAATRVKPEQASKGLKCERRVPSRRTKADEDDQMHRHVTVALLAGVVGAARTHAVILQHGRPVGLSGRPGNGSIGRRARQASEGLIRPKNPGNAGGGKEPWFGVRLNEPR